MVGPSRTTGLILYLATDGRETGRERFDLIGHAGGHTLRAFCEMDEAGLTRDVTLAMDRDWRPLDGFCRITQGGVRQSALWFEIGERAVRLHGWIDGAPTDPVTLRLDAPLPYLGLHPLQGDALIVHARGTDAPGEFRAIPCITNSVSPNGDEAVGARRVIIDVAYLGEAMVSVPAGAFAARHYQLCWDAAWPPADLWVRREDAVFLRMDWPFADARYELAELIEA